MNTDKKQLRGIVDELQASLIWTSLMGLLILVCSLSLGCTSSHYMTPFERTEPSESLFAPDPDASAAQVLPDYSPRLLSIYLRGYWEAVETVQRLGLDPFDKHLGYVKAEYREDEVWMEGFRDGYDSMQAYYDQIAETYSDLD